MIYFSTPASFFQITRSCFLVPFTYTSSIPELSWNRLAHLWQVNIFHHVLYFFHSFLSQNFTNLNFRYVTLLFFFFFWIVVISNLVLLLKLVIANYMFFSRWRWLVVYWSALTTGDAVICFALCLFSGQGETCYLFLPINHREYGSSHHYN